MFISEYIEGPSTNKIIELFNPTANSIDLSQYTMKLFPNGAALDGTGILLKQLSGTLESHQTFIFYNTANADSSITAATNLIPESRKWAGSYPTGDIIANHNGDDSFGLFKNSVLIDVFGTIGFDPGSGWNLTYATGVASTENVVMTRVPSVHGPSVNNLNISGTDYPNSFAPLEWSVVAYTAVPATHTIGTHTIS